MFRFLQHLHRPILLIVLALFLTSANEPVVASESEYRVAETLDIDTVPSSFRVRFCLLTHGSRQYVAYYNETHQMVVASRELGQSNWEKKRLPTKVGYDSHNYIVMAVDRDGHLHVSGNMHCVPLIYFRTDVAGDITTLDQYSMTGQEELRCTYPGFLTDNDGNLLFTYRSGGSGNGRRFYNRYDSKTKTWSRFLDTPLFEGENERNAYPSGITRGPDGYFHLPWVWRDTPDCATNHHLSYVRSRDLKSWETAGAKNVSLPLTLGQKETWVDPVQSGGGIINGCARLAFDAQHRPILSYHKRDADGNMQIYVARFEEGGWRTHAITDWNTRVPFSGTGSMPFIGIRISELLKVEPGVFVISFEHRDYGHGQIVLDEASLLPIDREVSIAKVRPAELEKPRLKMKGIDVYWADDLGSSNDPNVQYFLRWESLGVNHDRPHPSAEPPPSVLQLIKLEK